MPIEPSDALVKMLFEFMYFEDMNSMLHVKGLMDELRKHISDTKNTSRPLGGTHSRGN